MKVKLAEPPDVYGYTIFCEDIRLEVAGKLTYVGAYGVDMIVNGTFPFTMPKFSMHFFYFQRRPNVIPPPKVIVTTPGNDEDNPAFIMEVPHPEQALMDEPISDDAKFFMISGPITLTNFRIEEPGAINVRALRGDEYIRLGRLKVIQNPEFASHQKGEAAN